MFWTSVKDQCDIGRRQVGYFLVQVWFFVDHLCSIGGLLLNTCTPLLLQSVKYFKYTCYLFFFFFCEMFSPVVKKQLPILNAFSDKLGKCIFCCLLCFSTVCRDTSLKHAATYLSLVSGQLFYFLFVISTGQ